MKRLTISQYLQRTDAYPATPATIRRYIDQQILPGEKVLLPGSKKPTYYVHIESETPEDLIERMAQG